MVEEQRLFIVFDTETTGLNKQSQVGLNIPTSITEKGAEVCQIGGIILNEGMVPLKLFCHYCDTVMADSTPEAFRVHGINMRDVRRYILSVYLPEIMTLYLPEFFYPNVAFIGYNSEFDLMQVAQTLANSSISFTWSPCKKSVLPKRGRHSVDVAEYVKNSNHYRKLSSFENELRASRDNFLRTYTGRLDIETNCIDLLKGSWSKAHNSFFDALNTYLLWSDRVWKKKLI